MSRVVVINADDFGFSPAVNIGILRACREGLVTSVSLLMNAEGTKNAAKIAKDYALDTGVHVNLTDGRPLADRKYRHITRSDGNFIGLDSLAIKLSLYADALREAREEIYAQISYCIALGIQPSHLNSHKYVQVFPGLGKVFREAAEHFGIRYFRNLRELDTNVIRRLFSTGIWRQLTTPQLIKSVGISTLAHLSQRNSDHHYVRTTDHFLGIGVMNFSTTAEAGRQGLEACLRLVQEGLTEIMCHPGLVDSTLSSISPYTIQRERELEALIAPTTRELANSIGLKIVAWRDL
ncbi:MAG: ChbG/HpnK family deacetylase [Oligoflexia bacterium]|nr:ChbG/HpnK family deacetylase [Oligoflexia bacterium]